jgi:GAF domain-containing protein
MHNQDYIRLANELGKLNEKEVFNETLTRVATAGKAVFASDTCRIAFIDPHTGQIVDWAWADGDPEQYRYEGEPRSNGTTYHVLRTGQAMFRTVGDSNDPQPIPELVSRGLKSFASLPLIYGGRIIGILYCNYLTKQQPFDEHLRTLMEAFSARAAIALRHAHRDKIIESLHGMDQQSIISQDFKTSYRSFAEMAQATYYASFVAYYPTSSIIKLESSTPAKLECISVGTPPADWNTLNFCNRDECIRDIGQTQDSILIINDLESTQAQEHLGFKKLGTIKAFVALRLNANIQEEAHFQDGGLLILAYRNKTLFETNDLTGLLYAGNQLEARIFRRSMQIALQEAVIRRNQQLRSVIYTLKAFLQEGKNLSLNFIADRSLEILGIDTCTLLEYDPMKSRFVQRGTAGLKYPDVHYTIPDDGFKDRFIDLTDPVDIEDVRENELTRDSRYVAREEIKSVIIFPLRVEGAFLGLFFANFRKFKIFSSDEKEAIGLFADLASLILHESRLGVELSETQKRLDRHLILVWVSMLEDTWRHSIVQKAAAIRNYTAVLKKRLAKLTGIPSAMSDVPDTVNEIDKLANDIANAPPRVPQSWEMKAEPIPLSSLLKEVAEREGKMPSLQTGPLTKILIEVDALRNIQVSGYRRWLVYALEALLQNARHAMPNGGNITITGLQKGKWAEIRIKDIGIGVPETIRKTLFRDVTPKDQDPKGMGIGGLLVATIVEEHRGTIELERPGPGDTTVLIRLPVFMDSQA